MENGQKNSEWQYLRGICIIAVVLIHCASHVEIDGSWERVFYLIYRNLTNFPVAVFLFISGYFVNPDRLGGYYKLV